MSKITHVEFGSYLVAVGTEMRKQNKGLEDVIAMPSEMTKNKVIQNMISQGMAITRAEHTFAVGWSHLAAVNAKTYGSRNAITKAEEDENKAL